MPPKIGDESVSRSARLISSRIGLNPPVLTIDYTAASGAGAVPDGGLIPGTPLMAARAGTVEEPVLELSWGASCRNDPDYSVYRGTLGQWYSHQFLTCTTGGATSASFPMDGDDHYYLIVPVGSGDEEGSYGTDSDLDERPAGTVTCSRPQVLADPVCP